MPDLVSALRTEIANLERQVQTWKTLHDHQGGSMLTVVPQDDTFRVAMIWPTEWAAGEFSVMLAAVIKHVANNAGLDEEQLLFAIDYALDQMQDTQVNGGRVM